MLALLADDAGTIDALLNDLREKQDSAESTAYARARNDLGDLGGLPTEAIAAIFSDRDYLELGDVRSICAATRNVSDTSRTRLIIGKYGERPITAKPGIVLRSPRLKELHLRDSVINKGELLLAAATRCGDLCKLVLRWNDLDAAAAAADEIAPALEQLSGLQELELDHGGYHTSSAAVMSALARLARLRSLKVNVDRDCAAALARDRKSVV